MKKIISLFLVLVVACSFCAVSFADSSDSTTSTSTTEVEPRRAEPVEVRIGRYDCFDSGGEFYSTYIYRTYLVPAGKTLVCVKEMEPKWVKYNYELYK